VGAARHRHHRRLARLRMFKLIVTGMREVATQFLDSTGKPEV
jgi:hypothetical protein